MADVKMTPLQSSNIAAAGYDDATGELVVEFKSGAQYAYGAPREIYDGLVSALSPGQYFFRNVRDVYATRRIL